MNIDLHADIDETMLEDEEILRCPSVGHVLYLQVQKGLKGPTVVFPLEHIGWGATSTNDDGMDMEEHETTTTQTRHEKEAVIVPAVEGRILRFPGSAMHGVPKPPNRWAMSKEEERKLREGEAKCEHEDDEWMDDDEDEYVEEEVERSVLLFNTWADDGPPPMGVTDDYATGALPEGIELSEEDAASFLQSQESRLLKEWEEDYGPNGERVRCNPRHEWINSMDSD